MRKFIHIFVAQSQPNVKEFSHHKVNCSVKLLFPIMGNY